MTDFFPDRLTLIRERRGLSRARLAQLAGVHANSVQFWEAGSVIPGTDSTAALAHVLNVPIAFFSRPPVPRLGEQATTFRARSKVPAYRRKAALAVGELAIDFADWIAERFGLPDVDVPDLPGVQPEVAAEAVRAAWGLGNEPVPNLIHLLESRGVLVFGLAEDCRDLDAFAFWRGSRPFILLNTLTSAEHGRFDAAHELAHLVLHRLVEATTKDQEVEAHEFAAAFLLPRPAMLATGLFSPSLSEVLRHKAAWRVAAVVFTRRLHHLHMMGDWHYRTLMITLSQQGYRTSEPDGMLREGSRLLAAVLATMRSEGVPLREIALDLALVEADLRDMILGLATVALPAVRPPGE